MSRPLHFGGLEATPEQLLHRASTGEVDLRHIPLAPAARQLALLLRTLPVRERLEEGGADLAQLARAVQWKSLACLPEGEARPARAGLLEEIDRAARDQQQAIDRSQFAAAGRWLARRFEAQGGQVEWPENAVLSLYPEQSTPEFPSLRTFRRKCQWLAQDARVRRQAHQQIVEQIAVAEENDCSVSDLMAWCADQIRCQTYPACIQADAWFAQMPTERRRVVLFLALLELARTAFLNLVQIQHDAPLWIVPRFA